MTDLPRVVLLLETSLQYGRGLLRGIVRYERLHGPWAFHVSPGHFEHELPRLRALHATGLIARLASDEEALAIARSGIPAIVLEPSGDDVRVSAEEAGLHELLTDSPGIARLGAEYLLGLGFPQYAFCGYAHCPWSRQRQTVVTACIQERGLPCSEYHQAGNGGRPWKHDAVHLRRWLKSLPKPVGLMACNDVCGREVLQACAMLGIRVPDEVAVVGVDNDELLCDLADPPLSSVALDLESAGFAAAELLDRLMSGRPPESRQVLPVKPMRVVERRSTDRIPQGDPMVAAALRFIRDHAGRLIGVADVSEHSGVSRRTLERRFQRALGHGAYEEIARCRMSRAKRLLEETDLPACRVASAAGFGGIQPMMRMFRRREGCTPLEYRRNHAEQ